MNAMKRIVDVTFALAGLILLAPLLLFIAAAVKFSSPGPVFHRGVRTGRSGRPFRIFKFRSMIVGGEHQGGTTTGQDDSRVTPLGTFLRKHKLDELPQLLNVLLGEMSLVGPRPEVSEYTDQYSTDERRILSVRPGITDLASLEFHDLQAVVGRENPDQVYRERVLARKNELRLRYVESQTILGDARILWQTLTLLTIRPWRHDRRDPR
jgi:lipopolysaccharide/colanic/teichoic acid biosynthesis glycosyltransferase